MDDPLLVRRFERLGNLSRDRQRLVAGNRPARDSLRQILAFDEFEHERLDAIGVFDAVNLRDVRMIERRKQLRLSAEPGETIRIVGDGGQQYLDCDVAIQLRVARAVDLAHAARANGRNDFVGAKARAGGEGQALIVVVWTLTVTGKRATVEGRFVMRDQ